MEKMVNADLKILYSWLLANKISLNCDKTEIIFFRKPGEKSPDLKIKMNGHRIYPSVSIKYLGMHLDEFLNGAFHAKILSKKTKKSQRNAVQSTALRFERRFKNTLLCHLFVTPHICITNMGSSNKHI